MMDLTKPLYVGVAGWSYDDWRDTVYRLPTGPVQPDLFGRAATPPRQYATDPLEFLAGYLDMIEINSSFYRIPAARTAASWVRRLAESPNFFFTAKLNSEFTHEFQRSKPLAQEFCSGLTPLAEAGLLRGVLAQFRYDFIDAPEARDLLHWIRDQFTELAPMIVEVRHRSWEEPEALGFLEHMGVAVANLDYPTAQDSFNPAKCTVGEHAYLRLHGRNRQAWFSSETSVEQRYNYDYSAGEIGGLADRAESILADVKQLTIVANNHYQGKAVSAALRLKAALTGKKVPIPPALLETYPHLQGIARE